MLRVRMESMIFESAVSALDHVAGLNADSAALAREK